MERVSDLYDSQLNSSPVVGHAILPCERGGRPLT